MGKDGESRLSIQDRLYVHGVGAAGCIGAVIWTDVGAYQSLRNLAEDYGAHGFQESFKVDVQHLVTNGIPQALHLVSDKPMYNKVGFDILTSETHLGAGAFISLLGVIGLGYFSKANHEARVHKKQAKINIRQRPGSVNPMNVDHE